MRYISIIVFASLLCCIGCGAGGNQVNVVVMGLSPTHADAASFDVVVQYTKGGKTATNNFSGKGNHSKAFRADKIVSVEVKRTAGTGWIKLWVTENGKNVHMSDEVEGTEGLSYKAQP